ncbi:MAG: DUF805 domain-containing protein [Aeromonas sp.]
MNWYISVLKQYAVFSGRARRTEYWMFVLFNVIVMLSLGMVDRLIGSEGVISGIYSLVLLLPSLAVAVRRMHDTDRSGWWLLIVFIPLIGSLIFIYFMVCKGQQGPNRFGDDPKVVQPQGVVAS